MTLSLQTPSSMVHQIFQASPALDMLVLGYDYMSFDKDHPVDKQFFFPPCFDCGFLFIFYNNSPVLVKNELLDNSPLTRTHFAPIHRIPSFNRNFNDLSAIRVMFKPGAIASLFGISLHVYPNIVLPIEETIDKKLGYLYQAAGEKDEPSEQIALIEKFLIKRSTESKDKASKLFDGFNSYLLQHGYKTSIKGITRHLGYSVRNFNRLLNKELGISATEFVRIHRLNVALSYFHRSPKISLTEVVDKTDYFDQSHFIRDFKRMTSMTPSAYVKAIGRMNQMPKYELESL